MKIPNEIFGRKIDGALERVLSKQKVEPREKPKQRNISAPDLKGFIYVPSIGLYVSKKRTLQDRNWDQCHKKLSKQGYRMPIILEFIKLLKYAKDNAQDIYEDITAVRYPLRAEWLDAYFEQRNNGLYVLTENKTKAERLDNDTLIEDRYDPGISLEDWLDNPTKQGLPRKDVKSGSLHYWHPINSRVARFGADSVGTLLVCDLDPDGPYSWLWVHPAKKI